MKKSLAIIKPDRHDKSTSKNKLTTRFNQGNAARNAKTSLRVDALSQPKITSENTLKQVSYRNKNLTSLPTNLISALSSLKNIDISHNKLTDAQIDLLMNSCPKIQTLCIQGNLTSLIPISICKLKNLQKFRHDWVKLQGEQMYETQNNLLAIKKLAQKRAFTVRIKNVTGINFQVYCKEVVKMEINLGLKEKIMKSQCSPFAQSQMLQAIRVSLNEKKQGIEETIEMMEDKKNNSLFTMCGFVGEGEERLKQEKWRQIPLKKQLTRGNKNKQESIQEHVETGIKIQKIRDISETETGTQTSTMIETHQIVYQQSDMPLHMIFSKYDSNCNAPVDIDRLLLRGYNPNLYDKNGLSAFHIPIIFRQMKGLERLLDISFKNPGFFDLEMPSQKQGRNILHFSVFLKEYQFTKKLIEFGLPVEKRDISGSRILHLVDQNYQFLLLLRKLLKKKQLANKNPSFLSYPQQMSKKYIRHGPRISQQLNIQTIQNKNTKLLQMYERAVGLRVKYD